MNKADSERIATVLEKIGYRKSQKISKADLIVVNMCSVRQSAVDRVFGISQKLVQLKTLNPKLKTVLTGCILKKDKKKFKNKFDLILDIKDLPKWPNFLNLSKIYNPTPHQSLRHGTGQESKIYLDVQPKYQTNFSALIPISNGCNNFCSYCVVPYVRGSETCRNYQKILKEVKNAVKKGAKEIWLLGQNVNAYRANNKRIKSNGKRIFNKNSLSLVKNSGDTVNFAKLLKMVNGVPGNFWIRFTSPHPKDFSNELIKTMAKCQKITPYLNLPVQSGDNEILKKMNRNYTIKDYKELVKKIRKAVPEITLSTDAIVGFPGESKKQFEATLKLFKEIKFDMAYIAKYSPRPGTTASKLKDNVTHQEKEKRYQILTAILKKTALKSNKKYLGKEIEVLPEEYKNGFLIGKSRAYKTVKFQGPKNLIGQFAKAKITYALIWGLGGKMIKEKRANL